MPKKSNGLRAKRREARLRHEEQTRLAKIAADKERKMQMLFDVFAVLEGAHEYVKNKKKVLASGIMGFLSFHDINALAGTCTELRNHVHHSNVLEQPNHTPAFVNMHAKHFEARERKYGLPDIWSRNWECRHCGCNSHTDVVGDRTCFCETCKHSGCSMMCVESEASKIERRMGLGNYPSCYDSDDDSYRRGNRRGYSSGYHSSDSEDESYDHAEQQQIMQQVVNQQLAQQGAIQQLPSAW
jgi:hypothetical protein